jgi:hypothetical protein
MEPAKMWIKGIINGLPLTAWVWEFLDNGLKVASVCLGIVLTVFLIIKAREDARLAREKRRGEKIQNDLKEQEMWAKVAANKQKFG